MGGILPSKGGEETASEVKGQPVKIEVCRLMHGALEVRNMDCAALDCSLPPISHKSVKQKQRVPARGGMGKPPRKVPQGKNTVNTLFARHGTTSRPRKCKGLRR